MLKSIYLFLYLSLTPIFSIFRGRDTVQGFGEMVLVGVGCSCGGEVQRMV